MERFYLAKRCFPAKKQGNCSRAVRMIPVPMGAENLRSPKDCKMMYKTRNSREMALAVFLNADRSFSLSFLASVSTGLQKKTCTVDTVTRAVNRTMYCSAATALITSRRAESRKVEKTKQSPEDFKWKPPLNFRISMKGKIISIPSINNPMMQPRTATRQRGIRLNKKLYAAYSYNSLSCCEMAPERRSHFTIPDDMVLIIRTYCTGSMLRGPWAGKP